KRSLEYELIDTGVFENNRYFDIFVEYAKGGVEDLLVRITAANRGPEMAELDLLPTLWFRNTWSWNGEETKPELHKMAATLLTTVETNHHVLGRRYLYCEGSPELLFTENESNNLRLFGNPNSSPWVKDGINDYIVHNVQQAVNPAQVGTKVAAHYPFALGPGESATIRLRFADVNLSVPVQDLLKKDFDQVFSKRQREADEFYATVIPERLCPDAKLVMRQGFGGLLWSKQFYHYVVEDWLEGDKKQQPPPPQRLHGRNHEWTHL